MVEERPAFVAGSAPPAAVCSASLLRLLHLLWRDSGGGGLPLRWEQGPRPLRGWSARGPLVLTWVEVFFAGRLDLG